MPGTRLERSKNKCKRKIAFVVPEWEWGGGGLQKTVKTIAEELSNTWQVEILSLRPSPVIMKIGKRNNLPIPRNVKMYMIERSGLLSRFFALVKFLKLHRPDLFSVHFSPLGPDFLLLLLARKLSGISAPIVLTNHGVRYAPRRYILLSFFIKRFILPKYIDFFVSVSHDLQKFMERVWKVPLSKLTTIYNPIVSEDIYRLSEIEPEEYKACPQSVKIVTVARLDLKNKDFKTLLDAFALLKGKYPESKLFIVGGGGEREKRIITDWMAELSLEDSVFLLGHRPNPFPYLRYADVFVLSSFSEGLPTVIVEAMALGCPVVATNCPFGPRELIGNNENGIIVPVKDPKAMAEGIGKILEDKNLRQRIIENGLRKASEFFVSLSVRKCEKLFQKFLSIRKMA
ncbi:MAG: glycosyltransferase [bacterium]